MAKSRQPAGRIEVVANPIKLSRLDEVYNPPPRLGEHTEYAPLRSVKAPILS